MGVFTGFSRTGYNTTSGLNAYNRTASGVALGRARCTVGSITRPFNFCNRHSPNLNTSFACTFNGQSIMNPYKPKPNYLPKIRHGPGMGSTVESILTVRNNYPFNYSTGPRYYVSGTYKK